MSARLIAEMERERDKLASRASGYSMTGARVLASRASLAACDLQRAIKSLTALHDAESEAASLEAEV